jgi:hypothetical protein
LSCPYSHPNCPQQRLPANAEDCPECQHFLKPCSQCGTRNRAFANFCRSCRAALPATRGNWLGYKGSTQRLGLNTASPPAWDPPRWENLEIRETGLKLQLGESCRGLLGYDRHLIAIGQNGAIEIGDPQRPASNLRFRAEGPISCEPCIDRGILYLGAPWRLSAWSLGGLTLANPQLISLWTLPLSGTPVQALTVLDNRLYVTVYHQEGRREVQVIDSLDRTPPPGPRVLHTASRLSWVAADPASHQVIFFSQEGSSLQLHTVAPNSRPELTSRPVTLPTFADPVPIAFLGGKAFGVFGDEEKLCRIDIQSAAFEQALDTDTKLFSLNRDGERGWDGDGVRTDTTGVVFMISGIRDSFTPLERVAKGSPVILQGCAAVLGMMDGRIRLYDILHPPRNEVRRLSDDGEPIAALASFQNFVAAANTKGLVKVFELRGKGVAA